MNLKQLRIKAGLSLKQVKGIEAGTLSRLENGHTKPTWATINLLAAQYKTTTGIIASAVTETENESCASNS